MEIPQHLIGKPISILYNGKQYDGRFNRKSVSIHNEFNTKIKLDRVMIAPATNWTYGHYDHQFECRDISCSKCGTSSGSSFGCKCQPITLEQYINENTK